MTLSKAELRAAGMHEVGARLDDELEKAQALANAATGATAALEEATRDVAGMVKQVQDKIDAGELSMDEGRQQINGIEIAKNTLLNLVGNARKNSARLEGVAQGIRQAVESTSRLHNVEVNKAGMKNDEVIPSPDPGREAQGGKKTLKQQRLEEAAAAKKPARKKAAKKKAKKKVAKKKA